MNLGVNHETRLAREMMPLEVHEEATHIGLNLSDSTTTEVVMTTAVEVSGYCVSFTFQ